jgi:hypothetical protein
VPVLLLLFPNYFHCPLICSIQFLVLQNHVLKDKAISFLPLDFVPIKLKFDEKSVLHLAALSAGTDGSKDVVRLLLEHGAWITDEIITAVKGS